MTKKIVCVLVLPVVLMLLTAVSAGDVSGFLHETPRSVSLYIEVPDPVFIPAGYDGEALACSIDGFSIYHLPGMPSVVVRGIMAAIPPGARVEISTEVHSSQEFRDIDLAPVPAFVSDTAGSDEDTVNVFIKDRFVYRTDAFFPTGTAEVAYTGILRGMHIAKIQITPVQYNPVQRMLRVVRSMTVTLEFYDADTAPDDKHARPGGQATGAASAAFDAIRSLSVVNPASPNLQTRFSRDPSLERMQHAVLQSSPFAVRISTGGAGIHRVDYEDLADLGIDMSGLTNSNIKVENLGREVAVYRSASGQFQAGDYILFYAEDFQSDYSATNVYWLYQGAGDGLTMQTVTSEPVSEFPQPSSFRTSVRVEQDNLWRRNLPAYVEGEDEWFWRLFNISGVKTQDMPFALNHVADDAGPFEIELYMRGLSPFNHRTQLSLNGNVLGEFEWQGQTIERVTFDGISRGFFNNGDNTLTVEALPADNPPTTPDQYYLNWAHVTFAQRYVASDNRLAFFSDSEGGGTFEVGGFSGEDILVFDVSDADAPVHLGGLAITNSAGISQARFERIVDTESSLYALLPGASRRPVSFVVDTPSDLKQPRNDVDYIIITHPLFAEKVEQLRVIREQGGLGVEIVDIQDIYDEFSYGIKDVAAIRDFLQYAYYNWHATDHPTYVVLVGDATYDYRDRLGRAAEGKADLIPTYLGYRGSLGTGVGAVASDNWFVCVDGDDPLPDMVIGRLCVKNNDDLQNIIDKIVAYEASDIEEWHTRAIFAVDADDQNIFEAHAQALRAKMPAGFTIRNLYLSDYDEVSEATDALIDEISGGALITNYIGHGSVDTWSQRRWFQTPNQNNDSTRDDIARLTNWDKYTFAVILNCSSGMFSEVIDDYSMSEEFVRQPERGAVICVAASATGLSSHHSVLGSQMYENLFNRDITAAGAAFTGAKIAAYGQTASRDLLETFVFFGDPALELKIEDPAQECVYDSDCVDDAQFCTGDPVCADGVCGFAGTPCSGAASVCDQENDRCVECFSSPDCGPNYRCDSNVCVFNPAGTMRIDRARVRAGKCRGADRIMFSGSLDATETDLLDAVGGTITVIFDADHVPDLSKTTFTFPVIPESVARGRYRSPRFRPANRADPVEQLRFDTVRGRLSFNARNLDLTGLGCPITVEIQFGDYAAITQMGPGVVNGSKPCPLPLMMGVKDSLDVVRARARKGRNFGTDSIAITGTFTIDGEIDPGQDVIITLGDDTFTIPGVEFAERNGSYRCRNVESDEGLITAIFDTVRCRFLIRIRNADITGSGNVAFGINVFGNLLQASDLITLPAGF